MLVCRGEVREFGLTGLTRNQVSLTAPGVRIPPSPPRSLHIRRFSRVFVVPVSVGPIFNSRRTGERRRIQKHGVGMNSEASNIEYEFDDSIATVRLNRPEKLNAFTFAMIEQIRDAVERAAADEGVVAIIITGTGRAFSAGLDAGDLARSTEGGVPPSARDTAPDELPALFSYLLRVPKPVIAAVNGVTAGGGFVLAMMCDLRFAASDASFTTVFSKRGLIAEHGTAWLLPRIVGTSRALDLLWSSRRFDAAEGVSNRVCRSPGAARKPAR